MYRIGHSEDIHQLAPNRRLVICGVPIPSSLGFIAHSDGDIALHALSEAILGALALGDLGTHFPSNDEYKDIDSGLILKKVDSMMKEKNYHICNIDILIILEIVRLAPYIQAMREKLSDILMIDISQVSIKAATNENLDAIGCGRAGKAIATVLLGKTIESVE